MLTVFPHHTRSGSLFRSISELHRNGRLHAMLRLMAIVAISLAAIGCGGEAGEKQVSPGGEPTKAGYKKGDVIKLESPAKLYLSEKRFRQHLEITQAGSDKIDWYNNPDDWISLMQGSEIRVLDPFDGGMKVVVEKGVDTTQTPEGFIPKVKPAWSGEVGWIIDPELRAKVRDANYKPIAK
ncbi:hypothetical protein [Singulisphaera sp. PoT]|uniref:hypothetical protein n=1 Tax=Singulisphaera sp. PoT TaxID=3411797 RepID=UPI003BF5F6B5